MKKELLRKILFLALYVVFYLACFVFFFFVTFPVNKLKEYVVGSFNATQRKTGGQQELRIRDLDSYWFTGVKAKEVRLLSLAKDPGKPPSEIKVDEAKVSISLLQLLIGNQSVDYDLVAFGGQIKGSFFNSGKERIVDVKLQDVDLGKVDPIVQTIELPMEGKVSGTVKLTMPEGKASKGTGALNLDLKDVMIGDGKAKIKGMLALPRLNVGDIVITAEAKDGTLKVTKFAAGGKDLELQGEGRIQMRELAAESLADVNVRFKINDAYRTKDNNTKSLFGEPGSKLPPLFEMDPKVKQSKRADGFYSFNIRGPLRAVNPTPAGGGLSSAASNPFAAPKDMQ